MSTITTFYSTDSGATAKDNLNSNFSALNTDKLESTSSSITSRVVGPSSSTDNAVARFDSTTGKLVQDSGLVISDIGSAVLTLNTPNVTSGAGTRINIQAGNSNAGNGGAMVVYAGNATANNDFGGAAILTSGSGSGSGSGGQTTIYGGQGGATGNGGAAIVQGGAGGATSGAGGSVAIYGGNATDGNSDGGNIYLFPGIAKGSGTEGHIGLLQNSSSSIEAKLNLTQLASSSKEFTFPNATGVLGVVVTKTDTGDPTGIEGLFEINTFDNKVKIYADGAWRQLVTW